MQAHERVLARSVRAHECLLWSGAKNPKGYGLVSVVTADGRKNKPVHRVVYEALRGPIPEGMEIDHLCRVRNCVEISHLEAVTHHENVRRTWAGLSRCINGHAYDSANTIIAKSRKGNPQRRCRTCKNARHADYKKRKLAERAKVVAPVERLRGRG